MLSVIEAVKPQNKVKILGESTASGTYKITNQNGSNFVFALVDCDMVTLVSAERFDIISLGDAYEYSLIIEPCDLAIKEA